MTQTMTIKNTEAPATEPQKAFILKLLVQKAGSYSEDFGTRLPVAIAAGAITKGKASEIIDWLLKKADAPKPVKAAATPAAATSITEGFWIADAEDDPSSIDIWKVQYNLAHTNLYAKRLSIIEVAPGKNKGKFNYIGGGLARLSKLNPRVMTVEEAKKYGKLYGVCSRCGATLTHEDSIERMMGPVCYGYLVGSKGHAL